MLSSNETLFVKCYLVTSISCVKCLLVFCPYILQSGPKSENPSLFLALTLLNLNRISIFFTARRKNKISNMLNATYLTKPYVCFCTILWSLSSELFFVITKVRFNIVSSILQNEIFHVVGLNKCKYCHNNCCSKCQRSPVHILKNVNAMRKWWELFPCRRSGQINKGIPMILCLRSRLMSYV